MAAPKRKQRRKRACSDPRGFRFSIFPVQLLMSHETISCSTNFDIMEPFKLHCVILYYKPKKGLSSPQLVGLVVKQFLLTRF